MMAWSTLDQFVPADVACPAQEAGAVCVGTGSEVGAKAAQGLL